MRVGIKPSPCGLRHGSTGVLQRVSRRGKPVVQICKSLRLDRRNSVLRIGYRAGPHWRGFRSCPMPYRKRCSTDQTRDGQVFRNRHAVVPVVYDLRQVVSNRPLRSPGRRKRTEDEGGLAKCPTRAKQEAAQVHHRPEGCAPRGTTAPLKPTEGLNGPPAGAHRAVQLPHSNQRKA